MSVSVRVIPCLDVKDGRGVEGVNFVDLREPVTRSTGRGRRREGADEVVF